MGHDERPSSQEEWTLDVRVPLAARMERLNSARHMPQGPPSRSSKGIRWQAATNAAGAGAQTIWLDIYRSAGSFSYTPNAPSPFSAPLVQSDSNAAYERLRRGSAVVEDQIEAIAQPVKPYVPAIGRFLIVVTFLEDSLR